MKEQKREGYQGTRRANRNTARRPTEQRNGSGREIERKDVRESGLVRTHAHTRKNVAVVCRSISIRGKVEENENLRSFQSGSSRLLRWNLDRANVTARFSSLFQPDCIESVHRIETFEKGYKSIYDRAARKLRRSMIHK